VFRRYFTWADKDIHCEGNIHVYTIIQTEHAEIKMLAARRGVHIVAYRLEGGINEVRTASVVKRSEFLATDPKVRVRFPALSDFL
jgi:hypothetical protein